MLLVAITALIAVTSSVTASHSGHYPHIPVEGYEPKLSLLGQHVDLPEIPVKVIRITKTVAIKVPVPYPVKVPHNVPYPVHINKPYPVPVTQIVKVPHPVPVPVQSHYPSSSFQGHGGGDYPAAGGNNYHSQVSSYDAQEHPSHDNSGGGYDFGHGGQDLSQGYNGGGEHYEESKQVASPAAYHGNSAGYAQTQDSYHPSAAASSYAPHNAGGAYQLSQDSYQVQAEPSQYQHIAGPTGYQQQASGGYQISGLQHSQQGYEQGDGFSH